MQYLKNFKKNYIKMSSIIRSLCNSNEFFYTHIYTHTQIFQYLYLIQNSNIYIIYINFNNILKIRTILININ